LAVCPVHCTKAGRAISSDGSLVINKIRLYTSLARIDTMHENLLNCARLPLQTGIDTVGERR